MLSLGQYDDRVLLTSVPEGMDSVTTHYIISHESLPIRHLLSK